MFRKTIENINTFRSLENTREISVTGRSFTSRSGISKTEVMHQVWRESFRALQEAYEEGIHYLLITHDKAPPKRGRVSLGSRVINLIRSHAAGPYIIRSKCIQLESAFVVAIRPKDNN